MRSIIDIGELIRLEIDSFNSSHDLSIQFKEANGRWIAMGAVVLDDQQAASLAVCLINRTPNALKILKPAYLSEENKEELKKRKKIPPKIVGRTLAEEWCTLGHRE